MQDVVIKVIPGMVYPPPPDSGYASWPYDKKFHMLLNIAVGGTWGGAQGVDDAVFPATMETDYVRVYPFTR